MREVCKSILEYSSRRLIGFGLYLTICVDLIVKSVGIFYEIVSSSIVKLKFLGDIEA